MIGQDKLEKIRRNDHAESCIVPGRVMEEAQQKNPSTVLRDVVLEMGRDAALTLLDAAGVRGRGGGGFPTAHKWWLVSSAGAVEKACICNAWLVPGCGKASWFIRNAADKVIEATAIAAYCMQANHAYIALPHTAHEELAALNAAIASAYQLGTLGDNILNTNYKLELTIVTTPESYMAGEETALLEYMEGKPLRPRGKPPLPTSSGLFGNPTAINNIETLLQCRYALKIGAGPYRSLGTSTAPGTMVFSVLGRVNCPGLYEVPLGTTLAEVIQKAGGICDSIEVIGVFPGGIASPFIASERLDTRLDFDGLRQAGSDIGSGEIIVVGHDTCVVELAESLAQWFHLASCGKCVPCKEGTSRTHAMLCNIDQLQTPNFVFSDKTLPLSKRSVRPKLAIVNDAVNGIRYTDRAKGLDKLTHLCEFYRHRGDCHHSAEAAGSILALMAIFPDEFNAHMNGVRCNNDASYSLAKPVESDDASVCHQQ